MSSSVGINSFLTDAVRRFPDRTAVVEAEGGSVTYRELAVIVDRAAAWLRSIGVERGDRVGVYLPKSIDALGAILGVLHLGAAYVPIDPLAPASRGAYILSNCQVKAAFVERTFAEGLRLHLENENADFSMLVIDRETRGLGLIHAVDDMSVVVEAASQSACKVEAYDLAYVLYTSGSTGLPKGVMLTHGNARCFVDWCSETFCPSEDDRFSSHAPFHFDLSILDLYVPLKHGATVVLFGEQIGKEPARLAQAISQQKISIWYSAPSILAMLASQGRLDQYDFTDLRTVLFAGEVFPIKHLRAIKSHWPKPRYFNLFGPTETNVCTWHEIPRDVPEDRTEPYPIGRVCSHYRSRIIGPDGIDVEEDVEGELCVAGPGVMVGYWNLSELNSRVFLTDERGVAWYRTGDVVQRDEMGDLRFLGRRDRMIKKRGYRVELGEIEAALYRHPSIKQAAAVAVSSDDGVRIVAFLCTKDVGKMSIIALKQFCSEQIPLYMIPDTFQFLESLPMTSTDKVNYQALKEIC
jgi:amino acid adenylation domain-containing protein